MAQMQKADKLPEIVNKRFSSSEEERANANDVLALRTTSTVNEKNDHKIKRTRSTSNFPPKGRFSEKIMNLLKHDHKQAPELVPILGESSTDPTAVPSRRRMSNLTPLPHIKTEAERLVEARRQSLQLSGEGTLNQLNSMPSIIRPEGAETRQRLWADYGRQQHEGGNSLKSVGAYNRNQ